MTKTEPIAYRDRYQFPGTNTSPTHPTPTFRIAF